ncbi:hypothetical protein KUCAC02_000959 [Chaenocephalus aceratus]|uniref:Uncharacterized protein n=1 Tax=Chaenocephalus aceratus TaxID=36190 RepID=A0ACB9XWB4_CHAAC|nr:hypothetical protein KUCAC02_000959 [Chaenocephalus aceratus]
MASSLGGTFLNHGAKKNARKQDGFVRVRKSDLEKLTTEVMQLREFLPRVLNRDLIDMLHKARTAQTKLRREQDQLRQDCVHLQARLEAGQTECQKERELWQGGAELQQQADFCSALGSAACSLLWSCSSREDTVTRWLADTLESFVRSLDEEEKTQTEDHNSHEHQFVLALAGTITNIAAVTCGRDFLSTSAQDLLDTLMKMLELMKPRVFPKLKVISVRGLKCISENSGLLPLICALLDDGDWEVGLHSVRLLQSVLLEEEVLLLLGPPLLDPRLQAASRGRKQSSIFNPPAV